MDILVNDAVKCAIAERADKMKMLDAHSKSNSFFRSLGDLFEYMILQTAIVQIASLMSMKTIRRAYGEESD